LEQLDWEPLEQPAPWAQQEQPVQQDHKVQAALPALKEPLEHRVPQVYKAIKELQVYKVQLA
jgi:hypothetical protein